jgi:phosphoribosylpyrophosphate synthetase
MKDISEVVFLSGNGNHHLGSKILKELSELYGESLTFDHINFNKYPEGELDNRIVRYDKIKGKTVVFYGSLYSQELVDEAIDLIWALKHQYGANYIIGIFPFMLNRRQDPIMEIDENEKWSKKIAKPDEIQRLKKTIFLLSACGVNEMIVATPHSTVMSEVCKMYGIKFHEIDPSILFANYTKIFTSEEDHNLLKVYTPDAGSIPRAVNLARILGCPVLFNLKNRAINDKTSILNKNKEEIKMQEAEFREHYHYKEIYYVTPDLVKDAIIIMVEDEVASGGTSNDTGLLLRQFGIKSLLLFVTHAVLTWGWRNKLLFSNPFTKIAMTDTIPRNYEKQTGGKIFDISLANLFGSSLFKILNQ